MPDVLGHLAPSLMERFNRVRARLHAEADMAAAHRRKQISKRRVSQRQRALAKPPVVERMRRALMLQEKKAPKRGKRGLQPSVRSAISSASTGRIF
ncbi:hypothetical protein [Thioclava sp.]|uniref:hypothetical protein n=1 Tax=Thioclava sp. TaxID=1933450 RepID=UPI003AA906A9